MLAMLDTPYTDSRADDLSFALGLPPLPALATLPLVCAGRAVELRLLGASHQILADGLSETVACLPAGQGRPLPGRIGRTLPDGRSYDFTATTVTHDSDAAFGRAVAELRENLAGRAEALTGTFPGSPHAVTALALEPEAGAAAMGWRTWHAYPQTREIVMTRSRLVSRP
jgi:uncharacterized protein DUF2617